MSSFRQHANDAREQANFAAYQRQQRELENGTGGSVPPLAGFGLTLFLVGAVLDPILKGFEPYWRAARPYYIDLVHWRDGIVVWVQHLM